MFVFAFVFVSWCVSVRVSFRYVCMCLFTIVLRFTIFTMAFKSPLFIKTLKYYVSGEKLEIRCRPFIFHEGRVPSRHQI